jgi:hypothetical protein
MTKYVRQRSQNDCGVAALAMFLGMTYEQTVECIREARPDYELGASTEVALLLQVASENTPGFPVITHLRTVVRPALLCVRSPAEPEFGHAVYWDGERIWDPDDPTAQRVTEAWIGKHCYMQIQRVTDLVECLGSRDRAIIFAALPIKEDRGVLEPGARRAA